MSAPTIETPRLILRPWRDEDLEPWFAMNSDPRVMEFFVQPYTRDEAERTMALMRRYLERDGYGWWVLERKDDALFAGVIALQDVPFTAPFTPATEVGWRLTHACWGSGYATEGARGALDFAFNERKLHEVVAMTAVVNVRSQRVMQRLGMTHDPRDDFDHPRIEPGHPLNRHVLYRVRAK